MHRASLSPSERGFRSRLAQLLHDAWLLRGSLSVRSRPCGKPNCRCARGELHTSLYLVQSRSGRLRQLCIPRQFQDHVRQAVANYQQLQELIEAISELAWKRLEEGKPR